MEDAVRVLSAKFNLEEDILNQVGNESEDVASWLTVLGAYVLDNDRKHEEQKINENNLRKQRLNAEHQLSQLEKQLISSNSKQSKYEKQLLEIHLKLKEYEDNAKETSTRLIDVTNENKLLSAENEKLKQKYSYLEGEKFDFAEIIEKKNNEVERLNEEWTEMSKNLAEANKLKYEAQYKLDEIKNSDIRREYKEKRLEQEKQMLERQVEQISEDLQIKTELVNSLKKDTTSKLLDIEAKYETCIQEIIQLKKSLANSKETCAAQKKKLDQLMIKLKRQSEEYTESENSIQQELSSQTKLVQLYKEDRDHAKERFNEISSAFSELQTELKNKAEEILSLECKLKAEEEEHVKKTTQLSQQVKDLKTELENANDLLELARQKGSVAMREQDLSTLSPMAAATSAILKKGMTLTQIYSEYVKVSDELLSEKDENARLKMYMEQILREVEEKAPLLMRQKENFEHSRKTVDNLSFKLEDNIKECHRLQNEHAEYERKLSFYEREEKRLKTLCYDLSQQVRVLLREVEEARGGVVSSTERLPELSSTTGDLNSSSSGQVISEHLVTFTSIEGLQAQNQRLLATVRELSDEQEKLEEQGGHEIIHELKKKVENAKGDLDSMKEHQKTQEEMMQQLARQRDMYKVLCQSGGVMVGDISSTSMNVPTTYQPSLISVETELTKTKAELDNTITEHTKYKDETSNKQKKLNETLSKVEEELGSVRLERERLKNQVEFTEEKHSILSTTTAAYKKEIKAIEAKCQSITNAYNKSRAEAEQYKEDYVSTKEKFVGLEVSVKALETEKNLVKDAEKRLMQENQAMLDQQRSQNVLLTNLQSIQNNLERQEFETRKSFSKQIEVLQREMKALRRQNDNENVQMKITAGSLEKECKELKVKLGIEMEKCKRLSGDLETIKTKADSYEIKSKEFEELSKVTEARLKTVLDGESSAKLNEDFQHELERYKVKVRELEMAVASAVSEKKTLSDQIEVLKKHINQYKEIGDSNEQAIEVLTKAKETQAKDSDKKLKDLQKSIDNYKKQLAGILVIKNQIKNSADESERKYQAQIAELRQGTAPLERRLQEVTRALVQAKELETAATKESKIQVEIAREAQDKYERELVLHAKDVELLTLLKDELGVLKSRSSSLEEQTAEMRMTLSSNEELIKQMREHHHHELRQGEIARKDLIDQNAILHGQVEKLSAQLAAAKSLNRSDDEKESSTDKSVEDVYELLRFVRREKEISDTKAEASEVESMRYRQRAEHLQRDLDETKEALELELQRTQGKMLTEEEHNDMVEKLKKLNELEGINTDLVKQKEIQNEANKNLTEKCKKAEMEMKSLQDNKKSLEGEKNAWLAEKTALKGEIERWTNRTNQLMAQSAKSDNEDIKKLQNLKMQNEKTISAMQDDVKRTKQQFEFLKRESLKLKAEKTESQNKITSLQAELTQQTTAGTNNAVNDEQVTNLQKEVEESKKTLTTKSSEIIEKTRLIQQLKKVAKKYRTQAEKQQKVLNDNNLSAEGEAIAPSTDGSVASTESANKPGSSQEKEARLQQVESKLKDQTVEINKLTEQISELQGQIAAEKIACKDAEFKLNQLQRSQITDRENSNKEKNKEVETLTKECADSKKKLEELQEKNKKLLKTAKDRIQSLTRTKDSNSRENEQLKKNVEDLQKKLQASNSASDQASQLIAEKSQLESRVVTLENQINDLVQEKENLNIKLQELVNQNNNLQEEKRKADKMISQHKKRLNSSSSKSTNQPDASATQEINVATVRPSATPSQNTQKFQQHSQGMSTRTASIRPLAAHGAPTAMISPSIPASTTAPVASISALPIIAPASVTPHSEITQGRSSQRPDNRGAAFKAPVARVLVQAVERGESSTSSTSSATDNQTSEAGPSSSTGVSGTTNKRSHREIEVVELSEQPEDDMFLNEEVEDQEEPGTKRQRVEVTEELHDQQLDTDSQDIVIEEDDLLAEVGNEDGDDDVIVSNNSQEQLAPQTTMHQHLHATHQVERSSQQSPQEILRQRSRPRNQLPSFSLIPGQGSSNIFEETDDSTVPSTPTLYMPKRTDGFAEAVSSPVVRFSTFSFASNEQPSTTSQTPALEETSDDIDETRINLMGDQSNVPMTPLGVVPSSVMSASIGTHQAENLVSSTVRADSQQQYLQQQEEIERQEEQNVPQQIDLTEDDEEEEGGDEVPTMDDDDEQDEEGDMNEDTIEIFAPDEHDIEADERASGDEDDENTDSSSETSEETGDEASQEQVDDINTEADISQEDNDVIEERPEDESSVITSEDIAQVVMSIPDDERESQNLDDNSNDQSSSAIETESAASTSTTQDGEKTRPVRLQRATRGVRPLLRRGPKSARGRKSSSGSDKQT